MQKLVNPRYQVQLFNGQDPVFTDSGRSPEALIARRENDNKIILFYADGKH